MEQSASNPTFLKAFRRELIVVSAFLILGLCIWMGVRYRWFSKYAYYPGKNWQEGLEREMCKWHGKHIKTLAVTVVEFDWGNYVIEICEPVPPEKPDPKLHGYITFEAGLKNGRIAESSKYPVYLIESDGTVWENKTIQWDVKPSGIGGGGLKTVSPILEGKPVESIVDHFHSGKGWEKFGKIAITANGNSLNKDLK